MSHTCKSLIIHCIDFRFGKAKKEYLEKQGLLGDTDIVSVAGAVKNLVSPHAPADAEFIMRQIEISKRLHEINEIILMNHTDCGAYGGRTAFGSDEEETNQHVEDMRKAKDLILGRHPSLEITTVLARISPQGEIDFQEME